MKRRMMGSALAVLAIGLAIGCVTPEATAVETEEMGEVEQLGLCTAATGEFECDINCTGCGHNGLRKGSWNLLFAQFNRGALRDHGLWIDPAPGVTHGARSLCEPSQSYADHCVMRSGYSQWIAASPHSRVDIMTHLVAAIAPTNYWVRDPAPGGYSYWGNFNLRPEGLTQTWGYRTQETITAALLAQLNAVSGVPICLMNEQTPSNCNLAGGRYHESVVYGNHFQYYFAAISGGEHAPEPYKNRRFGSVANPEDANTNDQVAYTYSYPPYGAHRCDYALNGAGLRYATRCLGEGDNWYDYPVTVRTPQHPGTWYYDRVGAPTVKWPDVPVEDQ